MLSRMGPKKSDDASKGDPGYFEAHNETLKRLTEQRLKEAETINRCERLKLENACNQIEKKHRLLNMHFVTDKTASQQALKDLVAYRHVLASIAAGSSPASASSAAFFRRRQTTSASAFSVDEDASKFGRYGDGAFRLALLPKIEEEKIRMEPLYRRKAMCRFLLQQRRQKEAARNNDNKEGFHGSKQTLLKDTKNNIDVNKNVADSLPPIPGRVDVETGEVNAGESSPRPSHHSALASPRGLGPSAPGSRRRQRTVLPEAAPGSNELSAVFVTQRAITKL